jgi:hypothetical protein
MLEITGNDISELSDSDLRSLVGLLCEAELHINGLPTAGVTWGGHQNAKDGGIDVRVELASAMHPNSFIPRAITGFQVKKPDMPRSSIINEMKPDDKLKQVIIDLANANGAYIIVSSQGSTADSALKNRKKAMQEALSDLPNASDIKIDFYDRERIAGWVRCHQSLILWVREKIGKPIQGWQPYGNWAHSPGGIEEEYLLDEDVRLHNGTDLTSSGMSAVDGINHLRTLLRSPASSVRLTGLSGVGKTRLVQAFFDERIGVNALNKSQVFYADIADSPSPDPRSFAENIIVLQKPAILAIDNCPPDLHRRLTSVCSASGSLLSLITVEYDVREDQPEETEIFRLEPASINLIEKMIQARFSYISQVDSRTIADFSGGNARIAIALANTMKRGENLSNLKDEDLFKKLFHQRNEPNNSLLKSAEVCSLVYSFNCQTDNEANLELKLLSSLVNKTDLELYADVAELKRRDLVQQRSVWRAVLPHAIANRLAQRALENIPLDQILNVFVNGGSERLLKSFSRRLSYLHECEIAQNIADIWLSKNGLLNDVSNLNSLGINLFENIAPINPEATLLAIERASVEGGQDFVSHKNVHYIKFTHLLRSLAYDKELFDRAVNLLCRFALSEKREENNNSIRDVLNSLFYIHLSGTHASAKQRLNVIQKLTTSNNEDEQYIGMSLLKSALETWHFSSFHGFEFGARSRDYGFYPKTIEDYHQWFDIFIDYNVELACSEQPVAVKAKEILAEHFRGLWINAEMFEKLEAAAKKIIAKGTWRDGWLAVKTTIRFHGKDMKPEICSRLNTLERLLSPTSLIERAKLYALSRHTSALDLGDAIEDENEKASESYLRAENTTRSIGRNVAVNEDIFKELLPDILCTDGARLYSFGQGLADGCTDPIKMWQAFRMQLSALEKSRHNYQVLRGFLNALSLINSDISEKILDEAVTDSIVASLFPILQTSVNINTQGIERLKKALGHGVAPIWQYENLAYGRVHESINDKDFCDLLRLIVDKPDGLLVAIEILGMRLYGHSDKKQSLSDIIISLGQELLLKINFSRKDRRPNTIDYRLSEIIKACFVNDSAKENTKTLCIKLAQAFSNHDIYATDYPYVLESLAKKQPLAFLDGFLGDDIEDKQHIKRFFLNDIESKHNPMPVIDEDLIIDWCEANPKVRYAKVASVIVPYRNSEKEGVLEWTPLALRIINNSPDSVEVLNEFKSTFRPMSWSGSRAAIMQRRLNLLSDLRNHENTSVSGWACKEERQYQQEIESELRWEKDREISRNESFE